MLTFVSYDISNNKTRTDLIKLLKHFGMHRIQKSLFSGDLDLSERMDLEGEFESYLSSEHDSIILFPMCENCKESIDITADTEINLPEDREFKII
ncbi:CRISPR-associated endonuclease Cas2 [Methanobrevibacter curvatus]|uniref:CRISPR-associated endoribonuclease Cas2 n=1 Tax=Methanobrevibacter curvatus TaxID=49547 RepID=A0A166ANE7_9EURY|nr:CRISPR-associated endonuclease Cas2 [Methanobrevibacter curvatus]KZX12264.1 CRISPR-associated endoribonuclease Cas2 [Methanobrevibacter curvatus]